MCLQVVALVNWATAGRESVASGDRRTILCVGDSFTFGLGAEQPELNAYPAHLQRLLDDRAPDTWHVVNGGFPGRSSRDVLLELNRQLERFRPALVVTLVGYNDRWKTPDALDYREVVAAEGGFEFRWRTWELLRRAWRELVVGAPGERFGDFTGSWDCGGMPLQIEESRLSLNGVDYRWTDGERPGAVVLTRDAERLVFRFRRGPTGALLMAPAGGQNAQELAFQPAAPDAGALPLDSSPEYRSAFERGLRAAPDPDWIRATCARLTDAPAESTLWWELAGRAATGAERELVLATVDAALAKVPPASNWRAGLFRMRGMLIADADPDAALDAMLQAAAVDGHWGSVAAWTTRDPLVFTAARLAESARRTGLTDDQRTTVEKLFARSRRRSEVAEILTHHLELMQRLCSERGAALVLVTYPDPEFAADPVQVAIRESAAKLEVGLCDSERHFRALLSTGTRSRWFAADGHCNDAGYGELAGTIADAVLAPR